MARYKTTETTECKVYVGDLPRDADEKELQKSFSHYGALKSVWVARNPPGFAFIQFEDPRDAQDAVRGLDGSTLCGARVRVEHATGKTKPKSFNRGMETSPPPRRPYNSVVDRCYICGDFGHASYDCPRSSSGRGPVRGSHYAAMSSREVPRRYDNGVDRRRR
ncbi:hypothetical protein HELRODRAFT_89490 [Helobdella robusta]|uniref:RRM domain-containing protein n=1 Tax=Helobdella robusta TaxID=6412 RepID=T1G7D4_HELRO|nr:hypothetical protein HELRODRAFT_89490 [Helobdella robusta]ESN92388.1 hypothetical protein HELRODRAFT_89490 [Helobdella robusta]